MVLRISMKVKGSKEIQKNLKKHGKGYQRALAAALYQEGFAIDANMVPRIPVDTGRTKTSHYVSPPTGKDMVVEIGVGTDYAVPLHERTNVSHKVGEAGFLKKAVDEATRGYAKRLARRTKKNFKAGLGVDSISAVAPTKPKVDG